MNRQHFLFRCLQQRFEILRRRHEEFRHQTPLQQKEEIFQEVLIIHPHSTKKTSHQFPQTLRLQSATSIWSYIFFLRKLLRLRSVQLTQASASRRRKFRKKFITSVPEKSEMRTKENLTSATVSKIENVVSISTPFNAQVTEIDHREEVSYIVSEEFSE